LNRARLDKHDGNNTVEDMRKQGNSYVHEGRYLSFIAQPNFGVAALALIGMGAGWMIAVWISRRWLRWLKPLERTLRNLVLPAVAMSIYAGCGLTVLRVGPWVYLENTWIDASEYRGIYERNTIHPMHYARRIVRWGSDKSVETALDAATIEWVFSKAAGK
jgi:hypothetical protein